METELRFNSSDEKQIIDKFKVILPRPLSHCLLVLCWLLHHSQALYPIDLWNILTINNPLRCKPESRGCSWTVSGLGWHSVKKPICGLHHTLTISNLFSVDATHPVTFDEQNIPRSPKVSNFRQSTSSSAPRGAGGGTRRSSGFSACQLFASGCRDIGDWSQQMSSPRLHSDNAVTSL